jgi:hypothetical protein
MDLGTVKRKIENNEYKSIHEAAQDIRQIWKNCMEYNQDGSDLFKLAADHSKRFEEKFEKLIKETGSKDPSFATSDISEPSLNDKRTFARGLYHISKEQLGKIIVELDAKCPESLTKNKAEDEVEINVDKISPAVFVEMMELVRSFGGIAEGSTSRKQKMGKPGPKKPKVA